VTLNLRRRHPAPPRVPPRYKATGTSSLCGDILADSNMASAGVWSSPENGSLELIGVPEPQRWPVRLSGDSLVVSDGIAKGTVFTIQWHGSTHPTLRIGPFVLERHMPDVHRLGSPQQLLPPNPGNAAARPQQQQQQQQQRSRERAPVVLSEGDAQGALQQQQGGRRQSSGKLCGSPKESSS